VAGAGAGVAGAGAGVAGAGAGVAGPGAKALALVSRYAGDGTVVFWHTGGQLDAIATAAEALSAEVGR
jgi:hypothetical protein